MATRVLRLVRVGSLAPSWSRSRTGCVGVQNFARFASNDSRSTERVKRGKSSAKQTAADVPNSTETDVSSQRSNVDVPAEKLSLKVSLLSVDLNVENSGASERGQAGPSKDELIGRSIRLLGQLLRPWLKVVRYVFVTLAVFWGARKRGLSVSWSSAPGEAGVVQTG